MKNTYLQRMGITAWQLRDQAAESRIDLPVFFCCHLRNDSNEIVGVILADVDQAGCLDDQQNLLKKIAHALAPVVDIKSVSDMTELFLAPYQYAVFLGDRVSHWCENKSVAMQTIQSVSLSILQKDAAAKKSLWMQLKPFAL